MKRLLPLLALGALSASADPLVSYTGAFTETDHPTIAGAHVVTLTTDGTLSVPADVRLLRVLVVGGGAGGGMGGGGGGQVMDWTPEEPAFLKSDDRYTAVVGYGGFRSNAGSCQSRGHYGYPSSFAGTSFSVSAIGGGGGLAWGGGDGRWNPEEPSGYGNGGGGAPYSTAAVLAGAEPGAEGCHHGGAATNSGTSGNGCGGGGGGAGAGGDGGASQVLHNEANNDAWQDENGNYEHAGDGGPGVASDITGETVFYGGGGGGGIRRTNFKHGGAGGAGGGGRGAGLHDGSVTGATAGADGLGGGGGGGGWNAGGTSLASAAGGRGVVILLVAPLMEGEEPADRESAWAVGGTVSAWRDAETKKDWVVHEFRNGGTLVVKRGFDAELLLVGGGGSGGSGSASGGGAGGLVHTNGFHLPGGTYAVAVGAGGAPSSLNGGDTTLELPGRVSLVALGGGGGGGYWGKTKAKYPGLPGGSAGGSSWGAAAVDPLPGPDGALQGFPGGSAVSSSPDSDYPGGAGGGGAGGPGGDGGKNVIGDGGPGLSFDITGELRWYAGGGGGGYSTSTSGNGRKGLGGSGIGGDGECYYTSYRRQTGHPGADGTGSGGGGGGQGSSVGGRGGCGVLIVRYLADPPGTMLLVK